MKKKEIKKKKNNRNQNERIKLKKQINADVDWKGFGLCQGR